ncbi:MAG: DUF5312 domain-containing protein [Spirochaetaceae bacterium]|jgi:hypothetical protein|nr:DUF5312 domain-containing protein [Spirochaetaceae bacterium]
MAENSTFDRLSQSLGMDEKQQLLQKLRSNTVLEDEPFQGEERDRKEETDISALYSKLPWYKRLGYFLLSLFWGKSREDLFADSLMSALGREIELNSPGLFEWQSSLLLPAMLRELVELKDAARFFGSTLDSGVLANYGTFLIFLASLEVPDVHEQLQRVTNPATVFAENPGLSDSKLKKVALTEAENALAAIPEEKRMLMYDNARALFCLKELAFFLFDRLILAFQRGTYAQGVGEICPVSVVRAQLMALHNILFSLKRMPSMNLLSSMYIFVMQNNENEEYLENDREMQRFTSGAEKALFTIRNFVIKVPLARIIRCASKDIGYEPSEISGGEDWFSLFREKWIAIITENFNEYILSRKKTELSSALNEFFKGQELEQIEYARSDENPDGIPVRGVLVLSFLLMFHKYIYMGDMNNILRPILIDGEFYKRENRTDFTEAYNELIKIDDMVNTLKKKLQPSGEWGKQWKQINSDIQSVAIKHRKLSIFFEDVNLNVDKITEKAKEALQTMSNVLGGILRPDNGGKFDTLSNMAKIAGKTSDFIDGLGTALKNTQAALRLFNDIEHLEVTD